MAYNDTWTISEALKNQQSLSNGYANFGTFYTERNHLPKATEMFLKGVEIDKASGNQEGLSKKYTHLGVLYAK